MYVNNVEAAVNNELNGQGNILKLNNFYFFQDYDNKLWKYHSVYGLFETISSKFSWLSNR